MPIYDVLLLRITILSVVESIVAKAKEVELISLVSIVPHFSTGASPEKIGIGISS
jgi:hypothetical protein